MFRKLKILFLGLVLLTGMSPQLPAQTGASYPGNATSPFIGVPRKTGRLWYVDCLLGNDGFTGNNPFESLKTIGKALQRVQSGRGDVIFIYPCSYAENLVVTQDYLTMLGATGNGYGRPDIVPAAGLALDVNAQGFKAYGMRFAAPAADTDTVRIQGNGFIFDFDVFDGDAAQGDGKCLVRLKGSSTTGSKTSSEGFIQNNLFRGSGGQGLCFDTGAAPTNGVGSTDDVIFGNRFYSNDKEDIATQDTGGGVYSVHTTLIAGNQFMTKNKTTYIDLTTSNGGAAGDQNGAIDDNTFAADAITGTEVKMVGTGFVFAGNLDTVGVVNGSGLD